MRLNFPGIAVINHIVGLNYLRRRLNFCIAFQVKHSRVLLNRRGGKGYNNQVRRFFRRNPPLSDKAGQRLR